MTGPETCSMALSVAFARSESMFDMMLDGFDDDDRVVDHDADRPAPGRRG